MFRRGVGWHLSGLPRLPNRRGALISSMATHIPGVARNRAGKSCRRPGTSDSDHSTIRHVPTGRWNKPCEVATRSRHRLILRSRMRPEDTTTRHCADGTRRDGSGIPRSHCSSRTVGPHCSGSSCSGSRFSHACAAAHRNVLVCGGPVRLAGKLTYPPKWETKVRPAPTPPTVP